MDDSETTNELAQLIQTRSRPSAPSRRKFGCILLLVSVFHERLAFFSLASISNILMGYPYNWTSYNANIITYIFQCSSSCFAVLGAWLADMFFGKFKIILIGYLLYLIFFIPLPFVYFDTWNGKQAEKVSPMCLIHSAFNPSGRHVIDRCGNYTDNQNFFEETCAGMIFALLIFIGVGSSLIRSVITPYGAEQVQPYPHQTRTFFNWYYFSLNAGMIVAYLLPGYIQVNFSMFWGYMMPCISLAIAALVFVFSSRFLVKTPAIGESMCNICGILCQSFGHCFCCCSQRQAIENRVTESTRLRETLDDSSVNSTEVSSGHPKCLDQCKNSFGGKYLDSTVEDVKQFLRILLMMVPIIFFWACWYQNRTFFLSQGLHMKILFFGKKQHVPATWLQMIDSYAIFVFIPILDRCIYPFLLRHNISFNICRRMSLGMVLSMFAMIVAGIVEGYRRTIFWGEGNTSPTYAEGQVNQTIVGTIYFAANMSIFWQTPQYVLLGLGEAFTNIAGLEFAYRVAPPTMQSLVTGFYWLFAGFGSLLGIGVAEFGRELFIYSNACFDINYRKPCPDNPNQTCGETRLDIYFYILAGVQLIGLLIFVVIVRFIKVGYVENNTEENERSDISIVFGRI